MNNIFDISNRVAIITGGYGVLGFSMAKALAAAGAKVAILGRDPQKGAAKVRELEQSGADALFLQADVLSEKDLRAAADKVASHWGQIHILVNAAGGNLAGATIKPNDTVFDLNLNDFDEVINLNLKGTVLPSLVFGKMMTDTGSGSIINISSMSAQLVITRVVGYSASKAAIDNFTRWMSVEMAQKFGETIRVNAIAPGFFLTEQNRELLMGKDNTPTARCADIIRNTPFARLGRPDELNGALIWLASDASSFVTGAVIPIDGGFSVFSGV